jgi:hypothetical protein
MSRQPPPDGCDVWVDFNDIEPETDTVSTVRPIGDELHVGQSVTCGDFEGNRCTALVADTSGRLIVLALIIDTFFAADNG